MFQVKVVDDPCPEKITWGPDRAEPTCSGQFVHEYHNIPSSWSTLRASSSFRLQWLPYGALQRGRHIHAADLETVRSAGVRMLRARARRYSV